MKVYKIGLIEEKMFYPLLEAPLRVGLWKTDKKHGYNSWASPEAAEQYIGRLDAVIVECEADGTIFQEGDRVHSTKIKILGELL